MPERNVPILHKPRFMNCRAIINCRIKQIIIGGIIKASVTGKTAYLHRVMISPSPFSRDQF